MSSSGGELAVFVGETDATVELRVAGQTFFDAGHSDEDDAHGVPIEIVADLFEAGGLEAVCLVDNEQFGASAGA